MDRLFETAQKGNVEELHKLLVEHPFILHQIGLARSENPLHFASAAGYLDYAKELLKIYPKFAEELNSEGYCPVHLASAYGHVELVKEMIKLNPMLFRLVGKEGKTALHFAVLKGRVDVIRELLVNCDGCMEDVTEQGETALHLAVTSYQVESFWVMLDWVRRTNEGILNQKDKHGNTVLHLAVWKKQRQVLESILSNIFGTLEVNATNSSGLTSLDILLIFPSEAGDREIHEILQSSGAMKAQDLPLLQSSNHPTRTPNPAEPINETNCIEHFQFHEGRDSPSDVRTTLLVIAVLVTTATYLLGLNPPGSVWQDSKGHVAGTSILGTYNVMVYNLLIAFNTIGFCVSLYMIENLTTKFPFQTELQMCLLALFCTYSMAVPAISPPNTKVFVNVITSALPVVVPVSCILLRKHRVVSRVASLFRRST